MYPTQHASSSIDANASNFFDFAERHDLALVKVHPGAKNPVGEGWQNLASRNRADWEQWQRDGFNVGVHAGASRVVIFDLDQKHGGIEAVRARFDAWCLARNMLPLPHHVTTPSGGQHVFMKVPDGVDAMALASDLKGTIGKGVDVLTADRQSVAPGSFFAGAEGKPAGIYTFHDAVLYPAPQSVIDFCSRAPASASPFSYGAPQALLDHCTRAERAAATVKAGKYDKGDVAGLVDWLNERDGFDAYEDWLQLGMALRAEFGDGGLDLWRLAHDDTVTGSVEASKWKSFATEAKPGAVTLATFMKRGHELGWKGTLRQADMLKGCAEFAAAAALVTVASPPLAPGAAPVNGMPVPQTQDERDKEAKAALDALPDLFQSETEFTDSFIPLDYLVDGIFLRGFFYSVTAQTGGGKTAMALRTVAHIATALPFCGHDVEKGQALYMAGENYADVQMRWMGLKRDMGITERLDVHFMRGAKKLTDIIPQIEREVARKNMKPNVIIIDTAAAFFPGENENDNNENGEYARQLRTLCNLPGNPTVIVLCHPTKSAKDIGEMVPRGGGAFLNEVDGNIGVLKSGTTFVAAAIGKFRGPEFAPLNFALKGVTHPKLITSAGKSIPTVIAEPISYDEVQRRDETGRKDEDNVLELLCNNPKGMKQADIAKALTWRHDNKAKRALESLGREKLVACTRGFWTATGTGQKAANMTATAASAAPVAPKPLTPAVLGPAGIPTPARPVNPPPMPPKKL